MFRGDVYMAAHLPQVPRNLRMEDHLQQAEQWVQQLKARREGEEAAGGQRLGAASLSLLAHAEVHIMFPKHYDMDLSPREEWDEKAPEMAALFVDFMKRVN